jgi:hypothetical protein
LRVVEAGVPGLVICRSLVSDQPRDNGWQLAHIASGQVVAGNVWGRRADAAQAATTRLAPLADWTQTLPELAELAEPHRPPMPPVTVQITARTSITPVGRTLTVEVACTGRYGCHPPAWPNDPEVAEQLVTERVADHERAECERPPLDSVAEIVEVLIAARRVDLPDHVAAAPVSSSGCAQEEK